MRFSIDTGGTFTDLVVEDGDQRSLFKAPSTPDDPVCGMLEVLHRAAKARGTTLAELLGEGELLVHATTHALNAVLTGATARTALIVTEGHEAVLLLREGGRDDPFDFSHDYPEPYVPQALTFGAPERIGAEGKVVLELTEAAATQIADELTRADVRAVAVCLLWSIVNPAHELLLGRVLERRLPGVPVTLSHRLNPSIREHRRASSAALDASLRPVMGPYLHSLERRLREAGFDGRLLVVSSTGALLEITQVADTPIHLLNSGPAMAPVAGADELDQLDPDATAIVIDAGGTSFDVSVVRRGRIPRTRETWIGPRFRGLMTGFPSVDVRSIGAGGGSIASVDAGGLLHVGPQSAGSIPGPAAYGRGGTRATVTDAALVIGHLDAGEFLGGALALDCEAASEAIAEQIAAPLGLSLDEAAGAVLELAGEVMVSAIEDVTTSQGIDAADAVLVGGGGAAGMHLGRIAMRLGCARALLPSSAAGLSAAGALASGLGREVAAVHVTSTASFDRDGANAVLDELRRQCESFIAGPGAGAVRSRIELAVEGRYPRQVWELEVPLRVARFADDRDLAALCSDFHAHHEATFAFSEPDAPIELIGWRARAVCELPRTDHDGVVASAGKRPEPARREAWFAGLGRIQVPVHALAQLPVEESVDGPTIVETGLTTAIVGPGQRVRRTSAGALELIVTGAA